MDPSIHNHPNAPRPTTCNSTRTGSSICTTKLAPINTLQTSQAFGSADTSIEDIFYTDGSSMMDSKHQQIVREGGADTPPLTPVEPVRKDSISSAKSDKFSLSDHQTTELLEFPFKTIDYTLDKKNLLGSGLWSDVYLATPNPSKLLSTQPDATVERSESMTPPLTPVQPSRTAVPSFLPQAYAIKVPASTSAKAVIASEAQILSHLASFPTYSNHIVPFFGLDVRNGALVMGAMANTLENFIKKDLHSLDATSRTAHLAEVFPNLALNLVRGLEWLDTHGAVHADIKPANILLTDGTPVFADFSSSFLTTAENTDTKPAAPIGGGTWDFLCPSILTRDPTTSQYPTPSTSTDLYGLAITLLFVVIGHSPFDAAGNVFMRRDMVKQGTPLAFAFGGEKGAAAEQRCKDLRAALGWDVVAWLECGLRKVERRVGVVEWRESLEKVVG